MEILLPREWHLLTSGGKRNLDRERRPKRKDELVLVHAGADHSQIEEAFTVPEMARYNGRVHSSSSDQNLALGETSHIGSCSADSLDLTRTALACFTFGQNLIQHAGE